MIAIPVAAFEVRVCECAHPVSNPRDYPRTEEVTVRVMCYQVEGLIPRACLYLLWVINEPHMRPM